MKNSIIEWIKRQFFGTEMFKEIEKIVGKEEINSAIDDIDIFEPLVDLIDDSESEAMEKMLEKLTSGIDLSFFAEYMVACFSLFYEQLVLDVNKYGKRRYGEENVFQTVMDYCMQKYTEKHPVMADEFIRASSRTIFGNPILITFDKPDEKKVIKDMPDNLMVYHGTTYENYLEILKCGKINPSDYSELNPNLRSQTGYVYVEPGLDTPLRFGKGVKRKTIQEFKDHIFDLDKYINAKSAIFEIPAAKYGLYFNYRFNSYAIKGSVDIKDCRILLVERNRGKITITDKEGNKINDLLYE